MKYKCFRCGIEQNDEQFYTSPKGIRNTKCRSCVRVSDRLRPKRPTLALVQSSRIARQRGSRRIQDLKGGPCTDCHRSFPYYVMDFDHIGPKTRNLSEAVRFGKDRLTSELQNCELVCANCHRIRTQERGFVGKRTTKAKTPRQSGYMNWVPAGPLCGKRKTCCQCKEALPVEYFGKHAGHRDGLASKCKPCQARYQAAWHSAHAVERKISQAENKALYKAKSREYVARYKEQHGCSDCHRKYPAVALDFDHLRDKKSRVAYLVGRASLDKIIQEMAKCEVVCANCHRIRTHERSLKSH